MLQSVPAVTAEMYAEWLEKLRMKNNLRFCEGPPESRDWTGQPYVTLCLGGVKKEGELSPVQIVADNIVGVKWMMARAEEELLKWLAGRRVVVWRQRPEFLCEAVNVPNFDSRDAKATYINVWRFYCRLTAYSEHAWEQPGYVPV